MDKRSTVSPQRKVLKFGVGRHQKINALKQNEGSQFDHEAKSCQLGNFVIIIIIINGLKSAVRKRVVCDRKILKIIWLRVSPIFKFPALMGLTYSSILILKVCILHFIED